MSQILQTEAVPSRPLRPSFDAFFSYGFRPFFLGAAIFAVLLMTAWITWIAVNIV